MEDSTKTCPQEQSANELELATGRDEMNLAEWPLSALSSHVDPTTKTLHYQDRIRDQSTGESIARRLTITASDQYGLPTALDEDVVVALIQVTKAHNNFADRTVNFSRYSLLKLLGWPDDGKSYRRLEESLKRWVGVTLSYEKAWWDKRSQRWVDEHFHILDNVSLVSQQGRSRRNDTNDQVDLPLSSFSWNSAVFRSFQAENLKKLDLGTYFRLTLAPAKRAYRFLDKRFYRRSKIELDLRDFACEKVGLSKKYSIPKIKEKLHPSIEELERVNFIEPTTRAERYVQQRPGVWKIVLAKRDENLLPENPSGTSNGLEQELTSRGVTAKRARKIVNRYPGELIKQRLSDFDQRMRNDHLSISNPPGFLSSSIVENYSSPQPRNTQAGPRLFNKKASEKSEPEKDEGREAFLLRWASLSPTEQENIKVRALATAKPFLLRGYKARCETEPHLAQGYLESIIRAYLESQMAVGPIVSPPAA